jgi:glutaconate CoA-transferase subunit B
MRVRSLHPGITRQDVLASTGWKIEVPAGVPITEPPMAEELRILRSELDPNGHYLGT